MDERVIDWPEVSVVIPTRNRAVDLARCLDSAACIDYPRWELLVVDQSDGEATRAVVAGFDPRIPRLRYLPSPERGLSRARNTGLAAVSGEIVAFLDDDCTVGSDWLRRVAEAFRRHPDAGLVFGVVRAAVETDGQYVPTYEVPEEHSMRGARSATRSHGMGATLYMRRTLGGSVGPFDVHLGPGGQFLTSEDWDYSYRTLESGAAVVETPAIVVDHYGGRPYADGEASRLLRSNAYGHGALHVKLLRCRRPAALLLVAQEVWDGVRLLRPIAPVLGRGPSNAGRLLAYARGLQAGLRTPLDRPRLLFAD